MMTLARLGGGAGNYYLGLANEDYYKEGGERPGVWFDAEGFGLRGHIQDEDLRRLLRGMHPASKAALVQNAGDPRRMPGWDLCFSAPKSVSIAWALGSPKLHAALQDAHDGAVVQALTFARQSLFVARIGKGGRERVAPASIPTALFRHGTSRAQDMQLHTHALVLNVGVLKDGSTKALDPRRVYEAQKDVLGALYRQELASNLSKQGFELTKTREAFELAMVPADLLPLFSKRKLVIEALKEQLSASSPQAVDRIVQASRAKKGHVAWKALQAAWRREAEGLETLLHPSETSATQPPTIQEAAPKGITRYRQIEALQEVVPILDTWLERSQQAAAIRGRENARLTNAVRAAYHSVAADSMQVRVEDVLAESLHLVRGTEVSGRAVQQEVERVHGAALQDENTKSPFVRQVLDRLSTWAENLREGRARIPDGLLQRVEERYFLRPEQTDVLRTVSEQKGRLVLLDGPTWSGKTHLLGAMSDALSKSQYRVIGTGSTPASTLALRKEGVPEVQALSVLLRSLEKNFFERGEDLINQWKKGEKLEFLPNKHSVIVVDDAQSLRPQELERLTHHADKRGFTLVLAGDTSRVHASAFRDLCEEHGASRITLDNTLHDQEIASGLNTLACGLLAEGRQELLRDRTRVAASESLAKDALVETWLRHRRPESSIVLASEGGEVRSLNHALQAARKAEGQLGSSRVTIQGEDFHKGDRVVLGASSKAQGYFEGELGTIRRIGLPTVTGARTVDVLLDRKEGILGGGKLRLWPWQRQVHASFSVGGLVRDPVVHSGTFLKLAYAMTPTAAQGATVDQAYVYLKEHDVRECESMLALSSRGTKQLRYFASKETLAPHEAYLDVDLEAKPKTTLVQQPALALR